jgi:hypothetical protein
MGKLIDAATTLLGWVNYSATPHLEERTIAAGTAVKLSTPLDAAESFTFVASHPGHTGAVTFTLQFAPELADGSIGTWVTAGSVAVPAEGGHVEAPMSGMGLAIAAADVPNTRPPSIYYARVNASPAPPVGAHASLTY